MIASFHPLIYLLPFFFLSLQVRQTQWDQLRFGEEWGDEMTSFIASWPLQSVTRWNDCSSTMINRYYQEGISANNTAIETSKPKAKNHWNASKTCSISTHHIFFITVFRWNPRIRVKDLFFHPLQTIPNLSLLNVTARASCTLCLSKITVDISPLLMKQLPWAITAWTWLWMRRKSVPTYACVRA